MLWLFYLSCIKMKSGFSKFDSNWSKCSEYFSTLKLHLNDFPTATLLPHINCSFDSVSTLYVTLCSLPEVETSRALDVSRARAWHRHHILSQTNHFATIPTMINFQSCEEQKKKIAEDPFVTFHHWHVRVMFMQIGVERHWFLCSRRPKQSNLLGMTDGF